ncbi:MAG TPA: STAS domain-containing protein [Rhodocyclaceae bacterium]
MLVSVSFDKDAAVIRLVGSFDCKTHRQFLDATRPLIANAEVKELLLDLAQVDRLDSSALGLMLVTRDEARKTGKTISLKGARGVTKRALDMAQFELLFAFK